MIALRVDGKEYRFDKEAVTIGRYATSDVVIAAAENVHAVLLGGMDGYRVHAPSGKVTRRGQRVGANGPELLADGDVLSIAGSTVEYRLHSPDRYMPGDAAEQRLLVAIANGDDNARLVYADWCEQQGDPPRAEFLRVQHTVMRATDLSPDIQQRMARLRELAPHVDVAWRREVARQFVEGCAALEAPCPADWTKMQPTERSDVRMCGGCHKQVFYCTSIAQAQYHAIRGNCVAVDAALVRTPNDLRPLPVLPGAPPPPPR
ncbi:MAG TPA: TIGR02996 domain-containing protein [Kofleriaceae bacterium]|nr:TIGR02996 domain-containing protein [Kofleriaceae bacterium]